MDSTSGCGSELLAPRAVSYLGDVSREMVDLESACRNRVFGVPGFHSSVCYDLFQRSIGR